eukprot:scaffold20477_cov79-Isochrysis_galbana.AAC.2
MEDSLKIPGAICGSSTGALGSAAMAGAGASPGSDNPASTPLASIASDAAPSPAELHPASAAVQDVAGSPGVPSPSAPWATSGVSKGSSSASDTSS